MNMILKEAAKMTGNLLMAGLGGLSMYQSLRKADENIYNIAQEGGNTWADRQKQKELEVTEDETAEEEESA